MYYDYFTFPFWTDLITLVISLGLFVRGNQQAETMDRLVNRVRHIEPRVMKKVHKANINRAKAQAKA